MATFGWTTASDDDVDGNDPGVLTCSKYTLSEDGTADKMYCRFDPNGSTQAMRLAIWADNAGALGALKRATSEVVIPATGSPDWYEFDLTSTVFLSAADYWLGLLYGTGSNGDALSLLATSGGPGYYYDAPFWTYHATNDPPDPGGSVSLGESGWALMIYVNYTAGGGGPDAPILVAAQSDSDIALSWT